MFGFRLAVGSIGQSSPSIIESAVWLNAIFSKTWRVKSSSSKEGAFGGLEPLLSLHTSQSLIELLEDSYSKPRGVAHVSLESFTFGGSPPIIRSVEMRGVDDEAALVYMSVDIGMLLDDAVLLLDIKPSSLDYTMVSC